MHNQFFEKKKGQELKQNNWNTYVTSQEQG